MIWKRNGGNITFISKRGKLMYEKDFPQTNATIATLQVSQLVFNYLSIATRAFSIITYCHLLPHSGEKRVSGSAFIPCIILLPLHSETSLNELVNGC